MGSRRGRGEGSVYQRPDGLWAACISEMVTTPEGQKKRKWRYAYAHSKLDALTKLQALKGQQDLGVQPDKSTWKEYLQRWLDTTIKGKALTTHATYTWVLSKHVLHRLPNIPLSKVNPTHIEGLLASIEGSDSMKAYVHSVLRQAFNKAVTDEIIVKNPVKRHHKPKVQKREMRTLTKEQAQKLLAVTKDKFPRFYPLLYLALSTGMRQGELLGLQWRSVDLKEGKLRVERQLIEINFEIKGLFDLKTKRSRRVMALSPTEISVLKAQKVRLFGEGFAACEYVFPNSLGGPRMKRNTLRMLKKALKAADCPPIRFHDLRHTYATLALADGESVNVVSERLGHASPGFTLSVYGHVHWEHHQAAASRMDGILGPQTGEAHAKR